VLGCPPQELHDARALDADFVVLATTSEETLASVAGELRLLGNGRQLLAAGPGASEEVARAAAARVLQGDPIAAAEALARGEAGDVALTRAREDVKGPPQRSARR